MSHNDIAAVAAYLRGPTGARITCLSPKGSPAMKGAVPTVLLATGLIVGGGAAWLATSHHSASRSPVPAEHFMPPRGQRDPEDAVR